MLAPGLVRDEQCRGSRQERRGLGERGDRAALDVRAGRRERVDAAANAAADAGIEVVDGLALGDDEAQAADGAERSARPASRGGRRIGGGRHAPRSAASSAIRSATVAASGPTLSSEGASGDDAAAVDARDATA